ncbi:hypothetical protein [Herbidospora solisilvae]|nr:hypothetical protein [Herbidospora solisilvae]
MTTPYRPESNEDALAMLGLGGGFSPISADPFEDDFEDDDAE